MPNTLVGSLAAFDVSSSRDAAFYMASSGANRRIPMNLLEDLIYTDYSTELTLSADDTVVGSQNYVIPFDVASVDKLGLFNAASAGAIQANFNGFARIYLGMSINSDGINQFSYFCAKNGSAFPGGLTWSSNVLGGKVLTSHQTAVFTVASGDLFEVVTFMGNNCTISATGNNHQTRFRFTPVGIT